ncbi:MAG: hypothetical protein Q9227_006041 [Pyrenula ochraceoflavens]
MSGSAYNAGFHSEILNILFIFFFVFASALLADFFHLVQPSDGTKKAKKALKNNKNTYIEADKVELFDLSIKAYDLRKEACKLQAEVEALKVKAHTLEQVVQTAAETRSKLTDEKEAKRLGKEAPDEERKLKTNVRRSHLACLPTPSPRPASTFHQTSHERRPYTVVPSFIGASEPWTFIDQPNGNSVRRNT